MKDPMLDKDFLKQLDNSHGKWVYAKVIVLNFDEYPIEEIQGRITGGSINIDGTSAVRRSCSLTLTSENVDINNYYWTLNSKFKLYIGLKNTINTEDYPEIIWFNCGVFVINSFNTSYSTNSYSISISGQDKMCLLNGTLGGVIESVSADFGTYDEIDEDGNITNKDQLIKDIILEAVHHYGREPFHNIVIEDLDITGLELMEYRGDVPFYILFNVNTETSENIVFEDDAKAGEWYLYNTTQPVDILDENFKYDNRISSKISESGQTEPTYIYSKENPSGKYSVIKIDYGTTCGYRVTDLTFADGNGTKNLILSTGDAVTSVLDKIVNMLGDYEYFYDVDGVFHFRKKRIYQRTSWNNICKSTDGEVYEENSAYVSPYSYSFTDSALITSFQNQPDLTNLKNDFAIWGTNDSNVKFHLRYAIDKKPEKYTALDGTVYTSDTTDWREIIYQMALDYYKHQHDDDFLAKVAEKNRDLYPLGYTGYEIYYADIQGFWRYIYDPTIKPIEIAEDSIPDSSVPIYYMWDSKNKKYIPYTFNYATETKMPTTPPDYYYKKNSKITSQNITDWIKKVDEEGNPIEEFPKDKNGMDIYQRDNNWELFFKNKDDENYSQYIKYLTYSDEIKDEIFEEKLFDLTGISKTQKYYYKNEDGNFELCDLYVWDDDYTSVGTLSREELMANNGNLDKIKEQINALKLIYQDYFKFDTETNQILNKEEGINLLTTKYNIKMDLLNSYKSKIENYIQNRIDTSIEITDVQKNQGVFIYRDFGLDASTGEPIALEQAKKVLAKNEKIYNDLIADAEQAYNDDHSQDSEEVKLKRKEEAIQFAENNWLIAQAEYENYCKIIEEYPEVATIAMNGKTSENFFVALENINSWIEEEEKTFNNQTKEINNYQNLLNDANIITKNLSLQTYYKQIGKSTYEEAKPETWTDTTEYFVKTSSSNFNKFINHRGVKYYAYSGFVKTNTFIPGRTYYTLDDNGNYQMAVGLTGDYQYYKGPSGNDRYDTVVEDGGFIRGYQYSKQLKDVEGAPIIGFEFSISKDYYIIEGENGYVEVKDATNILDTNEFYNISDETPNKHSAGEMNFIPTNTYSGYFVMNPAKNGECYHKEDGKYVKRTLLVEFERNNKYYTKEELDGGYYEMVLYEFLVFKFYKEAETYNSEKDYYVKNKTKYNLVGKISEEEFNKGTYYVVLPNTEVKLYTDNRINPETFWTLSIDTPENLIFWFDFLDSTSGSELSKYGANYIGNRTKAINDDSVKAIYYRDTPDIIFIRAGQTDPDMKSGYTYIYLTDNMYDLFAISKERKTAYDELDACLYENSYCTENITINAIPIYYLEPNTRISVYDEKSGINGDYIVSRISLPLTYNGTMSITATRAVSRIY